MEATLPMEALEALETRVGLPTVYDLPSAQPNPEHWDKLTAAVESLQMADLELDTTALRLLLEFLDGQEPTLAENVVEFE
jgi:hypothetical protein